MLSPTSRAHIVRSIAALSGALVGPMPKRSRRTQVGLANLGHWAKKRRVLDSLEAEEKENVSLLTTLHN